MANRYNDQDYPRYYERNDRYDSRSERSGDRNTERNRSGSGREYVQGGSSDYSRDDQEGYYGMSYNRDSMHGQDYTSGFSGGYFGSDFGRGYSSEDRNFDDFATSTRPAHNLTGGFSRNTGSDRDDYTLYGYDRESRYAATERDNRDYGERGGNYSQDRGNYDRQANYGRSGGSGYDRQRQDRQSYDRGFNNDRDESSRNRESNFGEGRSSYGQGGGDVRTERGYINERERGGQQQQFRGGQQNRGGEDRTWWDRTTDEVSSWFGDNEAARRRQTDQREQERSGQHRGRGPRNYRRSDERIRDDINDRLTDYPHLDASDIDVEVNNCEVILTGTVDSRYAKRMAEDIVENVSGVSHVENRLRVNNQQNQQGSFSGSQQRSPESLSLLDDTSLMTGGTESSGETGASTGASMNTASVGTSNESAMGAAASGGVSTGKSAGTSTDATTGTSSTTGSTTTASDIDSAGRGVDRLSKRSK